MDFLLENEHFGLDSWRLCMEKNSFFVFNMKLWLNMWNVYVNLRVAFLVLVFCEKMYVDV